MNRKIQSRSQSTVQKKISIVQTMRILNRFITSLMFLFGFCPTGETASLDLRLDDPSLLLLLLSKTQDLIDFTPTGTNFREEEEEDEDEDEGEREEEEASTSLNEGLLDPKLVSARR
jgi:hypothetical protein